MKAWVLQRLTAVYMVLFIAYLVLALVLAPPEGFDQWRAWIRDPVRSIAIALFYLAMLLHAWIGIRDVILDYVHPFGVRVAALSLVGVALLACGLWAARLLIVTG